MMLEDRVDSHDRQIGLAENLLEPRGFKFAVSDF